MRVCVGGGVGVGMGDRETSLRVRAGGRHCTHQNHRGQKPVSRSTTKRKAMNVYIQSNQDLECQTKSINLDSTDSLICMCAYLRQYLAYGFDRR